MREDLTSGYSRGQIRSWRMARPAE